MSRWSEDSIDQTHLVVDGIPVMRLHSATLSLARDPGWCLEEHLSSCPNGAFVAVPDRHTILAHPIRDWSAIAAVSALVGEAGRGEQARVRGRARPPRSEIYFWPGDCLNLYRVALVHRDGKAQLDPRDADLIGRIAELPPVALSLREEALAGSEDAAIQWAAQSWRQGADAEADSWADRLQAQRPTAALLIAWAMVWEGEEACESGSPYDGDQEQDFLAAARWLQHRADQGDPVAQWVCDELGVADVGLQSRLIGAMRTVGRAFPSPKAEPPLACFSLGPAVLGLDDIEDILAVLRERGEPEIIGCGRRQIIDFYAPRGAALRALRLTSMDQEVSVMLRPHGSAVSGPLPTADRIWRIVDSRHRRWVAFTDPWLWGRAMLPGAVALLVILLGRTLAAAEGGYYQAIDPYLIVVVIGIGIHAGYRLVTLSARDERPRPGYFRGGPVRIRGTRRHGRLR